MAVIWRVGPWQMWRGPVEQAAAAIRAGGVVAVPTDTLYGLAADPFQPAAVRRLFRLKRRPESKPILLLVNSLAQVERLAPRLPAVFERVAARFWPGPLTIVLRAGPATPESITAGTGTVAVRWPGSVLTRELIRAARVPLTGTSANLSGRPAARSAQAVSEQLRDGLAGILDGGPASDSTPSTILDLTAEPRVVREGAVATAAVLAVCEGAR